MNIDSKINCIQTEKSLKIRNFLRGKADFSLSKYFLIDFR